MPVTGELSVARAPEERALALTKLRRVRRSQTNQLAERDSRAAGIRACRTRSPIGESWVPTNPKVLPFELEVVRAPAALEKPNSSNRPLRVRRRGRARHRPGFPLRWRHAEAILPPLAYRRALRALARLPMPMRRHPNRRIPATASAVSESTCLSAVPPPIQPPESGRAPYTTASAQGEEEEQETSQHGLDGPSRARPRLRAFRLPPMSGEKENSLE